MYGYTSSLTQVGSRRDLQPALLHVVTASSTQRPSTGLPGPGLFLQVQTPAGSFVHAARVTERGIFYLAYGHYSPRGRLTIISPDVINQLPGPLLLLN